MRLMSLRCVIGLHQPSLSSITRRQGGYAGICEHCARPLERGQQGRWVASEPVYQSRGGAR